MTYTIKIILQKYLDIKLGMPFFNSALLFSKEFKMLTLFFDSSLVFRRSLPNFHKNFYNNW